MAALDHNGFAPADRMQRAYRHGRAAERAMAVTARAAFGLLAEARA
ncbi:MULTISPECIES: hypothetical protein [unclassified Lysobacter]|nr:MULTISPECIES: hypothetical protein [unclassified Lysobacter]